MELLLNLIVWIGFFSWDQCCFNMRLIKGQDGDPGAPNLARQNPCLRAAPAYHHCGPDISISALCTWLFRPYNPDADKNSISNPNEANPFPYPTPKGMPTIQVGSRETGQNLSHNMQGSFSLPGDFKLHRTFKRGQTTFLNFWSPSIFQVFF